MLTDRDPPYGGNSELPPPVELLAHSEVVSCFDALSQNHTLDAKYRMLGTSDTVYYPCSSSMKFWISIFGLNDIIGEEDHHPIKICSSRSFTVDKFKEHLRSKKGCIFHDAISMYLEDVYGNI